MSPAVELVLGVGTAIGAVATAVIVVVRQVRWVLNSPLGRRLLSAARQTSVNAALDTIERNAGAVVSSLDVSVVQPKKDPANTAAGVWTPEEAAAVKQWAVDLVKKQNAAQIAAAQDAMSPAAVDDFVAGVIEKKVAELRAGAARVIVTIPPSAGSVRLTPPPPPPSELRTPAQTPSSLRAAREKKP